MTKEPHQRRGYGVWIDAVRTSPHPTELDKRGMGRGLMWFVPHPSHGTRQTEYGVWIDAVRTSPHPTELDKRGLGCGSMRFVPHHILRNSTNGVWGVDRCGSYLTTSYGTRQTGYGAWIDAVRTSPIPRNWTNKVGCGDEGTASTSLNPPQEEGRLR